MSLQKWRGNNVMIDTWLLSNIILKETGKNVSYDELDFHEQVLVLSFIKNNKLGIKFLKERGYDVLTKQFFAYEECLDDEFEQCPRVIKVRRNFCDFDTFYKYVDGEIYLPSSCFYGYQFSKEQIEKYNLHIEKMNFNSYTTRDITQETVSLEQVKYVESQMILDNVERCWKIDRWIKRNSKITSFSDFEEKKDKFVTKFSGFEYSPFYRDVFISLLINKDKKSIRKYVAKSVGKAKGFYQFSIDLLFYKYGIDFIIKTLQKCDEQLSNKYKRAVMPRIEEIKNCVANKLLKTIYESGYDEENGFYYVDELGYKYKELIVFNRDYFCSIDEMASFLNGVLSGSDLSHAPILDDEIKKYRYDETTKFPITQKTYHYEIIKKYENGQFVVIQTWYVDGESFWKKTACFEMLFDFVHYLQGDLSNATLISCDGIENIKGLKNIKIDGIKTRSDVSKILGLPLEKNAGGIKKEFDCTLCNERDTSETFLIEHPANADFNEEISYISDIHLQHRFDAYKCITIEDTEIVIDKIVKNISKDSTKINIIAGDTSSSFSTFENFVRNLKSMDEYKKKYFFTLGNHELWDFDDVDLDFVVRKYKNVLNKNDMYLIHNNLYFMVENGPYSRKWYEITTKELMLLSKDELLMMTREARCVIFGGIGFAGKNTRFNADSGIYFSLIDRTKEIEESKTFFDLYKKVIDVFRGKNLVVVTHMPMIDWAGTEEYVEGVIYISGHNHRNYFYDDGIKRIYADNQVGYKVKLLGLKRVSFDTEFDWFDNYPDGIHEIKKYDYMAFYRGINETVFFNRQFKKMYMIKHDGAYMFFVLDENEKLKILNGGSCKLAGEHDLKYFYDNIVIYSESIRKYLSKYDAYQKKIASEIKSIGGVGTIHGCIIDIDYYNHIYLNPLDGSITSYFANSIKEKYVYQNLPSLLKAKCPSLYGNYNKTISQGACNALIEQKQEISDQVIFVEDTEIYRVSRIIRGLQYTTKHNVVRLWNDSFVTNNVNEENGKLIVKKIVYPDSLFKNKEKEWK